MGIRKLLGLRSQMEKIKDYRDLLREVDEIEKETALMAENFSLQKSTIDSLSGETDPQISAEVLNRFNAFTTQQAKDVSKLCNRKVRIEKSIQNLEKDEEIADAVKELKSLYETRQKWKKGHISKSIYFNLLKAKMGKTHFADILVFRGEKLLVLQRAKDGGLYTDEWCVPGGHIDPGEEPLEAAVRELYEETGLKIDPICLDEVGVYENKDVKIHYFMTHLDSHTPANIVVDSSEEIGSEWISLGVEFEEKKFIFDMKDNLEKILGLQRINPAVTILKAYADGNLSDEVLMDFAKNHKEDIEKANNKDYFSHKERKDLAKKGEAMPNGKYPIRNSQDLKDAIRLVGASSMPEGEVKAWIKKRAKALGLTDELPEDWEIEKAADTEDAQTLAEESLDEDEKNVTHPQTDENGEEIEKGLPEGFGVYVNFDDMDEANIFKSLVENWKETGKLEHVSHVIEKGFEEEEDLKKKDENNVGTDSLEKAKDKKKLFLDFINFLQGMVTRKDNLHWSELDNSKHVYLDSVGDELNDFKDTIAEAGQSIFGRFDANTVKAEEIEENDPLKFIKLLFERTTDFREALEGDRNYFGELSYIDDFLVKTKQSMYRLQMH